jgi:hypothetical protein
LSQIALKSHTKCQQADDHRKVSTLCGKTSASNAIFQGGKQECYIEKDVDQESRTPRLLLEDSKLENVWRSVNEDWRYRNATKMNGKAGTRVQCEQEKGKEQLRPLQEIQRERELITENDH